MNLLLRNWQPFTTKFSVPTRVTIFPEKNVP